MRRTMDAPIPMESQPVILLHPENYKGLYLHSEPMSSTGYGAFEIALRPAETKQDLVRIPLNISVAKPDGQFGPQLPIAKYLLPEKRDGWYIAQIPLAALGVPKAETGKDARICGLALTANSTSVLPDVFVRHIALLPDITLPTQPLAATVAVKIDVAANRHAISPYVYGVAFGSTAALSDLHPGMHRWGGNPNTRYNWLTNAWNSARDWQFRNHGDNSAKPTEPGKAASDFVTLSRTGKAAVLFTIPTIGWVARDGDTQRASVNVPAKGDMPLTTAEGAIAGYDPTENRERTSVRSVARKGSPLRYPPLPQPSEPGKDFAVAQDEFVYFLTKRFGTAKSGGVRFYAMDNEPDLWGSDTYRCTARAPRL